MPTFQDPPQVYVINPTWQDPAVMRGASLWSDIDGSTHTYIRLILSVANSTLANNVTILALTYDELG